MTLVRQIAALNADWAIVLLTVGVLLIYVELNRPGWVIPGAVGLLATLFAVASVGRLGVSVGGVALVGTGVGLLGVDLVRRTSVVVSVAATLAVVLGFRELVEGPGVHIVTAVGCGVILGVGTAILTRVARRARTNKGLD